MNRFRFILICWYISLIGCTSNEQIKHEPSETQVLRFYLKKTFNTADFPFYRLDESHLILITGHGCSYCNHKVMGYINSGLLDRTFVITSEKRNQSELIMTEHVFYDTLQKNLQHINLRCNEGPVYLKLQKDSVVDNIFITSLNVDSLFTAIEN